MPHPKKENVEGLKIMSFNVRLFNLYGWIDQEEIPEKVEAFIDEEAPDIVCFQEFTESKAPAFAAYPYRYFYPSLPKGSRGPCILSKLPLHNSGYIPFEDSNRYGIYSDLIWKGDTIRIYNLHLESLKINTKDTLLPQGRKKMIEKVNDIFDLQQEQIAAFNTFAAKAKHPAIICTDLNNNAFSKAYREITTERKDAFTEAGKGLGRTYSFLLFPLRIDYIFTDPQFNTVSFKTADITLSDHKPITAVVRLE